MTKINLFTLLLLSLFLTLCVNAQKVRIDKSALGQVRKVYVEGGTSALPITKGLASYLRTELAKYGFVISDTKENVDAILSSELSAQVTLDGDRSNPPDKAIYYCRLSSASGTLYWKESVKFVLKSDWTANNKFGAQEIAKMLYKDWQKSAKKLAEK